MKKRYAIAALAASLHGCGLHFLYDFLPNPLVAAFAPVNESPWEHLKLVFWPTLLAAAVLAWKSRNREGTWSTFFLAELVMPLALLAGFAALVAMGADSVAADILLYFLTMFGGFAMAYSLRNNQTVERYGGFLLMFVILYGSMLILLTYAAPDAALFRSP